MLDLDTKDTKLSLNKLKATTLQPYDVKSTTLKAWTEHKGELDLTYTPIRFGESPELHRASHTTLNGAILKTT